MYLGSEAPEKPTVISESDVRTQPEATESSVGEKPAVDLSEEASVPAAQPEREPDIGDPPAEVAAAIPVPAPTREEAPQKVVSAQPVYSVQVGAFRDEAKAAERVARFRKKGYEAYIVPPAPGEKGALSKVRVGQFRKREEADAMARKIRQKEGIQAFVTYR